jgi:hypothetical protein
MIKRTRALRSGEREKGWVTCVRAAAREGDGDRVARWPLRCSHDHDEPAREPVDHHRCPWR